MPLARRHPAHELLLAILFVVGMGAAYINVAPINNLDWVTTAQFLRYMTRFQNPYASGLPMDNDLLHYHIGYEYLPYSPWTIFYFGILAYATTRLVIALTIAAWMVVIVDCGKLSTLILVLHPIFLMLWAAGNTEFLVNGIGLWLILRGVRGWRRGVAIMLMAIKPQVLPLLILLECARIVWERDWEALGTMGAIFGVSVALFPKWLDWVAAVASSYLDFLPGIHAQTGINYGCDYSFSVFGAWGVLPALAVTAVILLIMVRRLTEWRTLAVLLGFVWTPYVNPYSFASLLVLFRRTPAWRTLLYLGISLALLPVFFTQWHHTERYGVLLFLLLAAVFISPMADQTEENIAQRHHKPPLPMVQRLLRWQHLPAVTESQDLSVPTA